MIVVDASVAVLWTQEDSEDARAPQAKRVAQVLLDEGLHVPPIFLYEMANVIHHKNPRGSLPQRQMRLRSVLQMVAQAPQDVAAVGLVADARGLSAYDAAYVELAKRHGGTLLTEDAKQHAAGVRELGRKRSLRLAKAVVKWLP